MLELLEDLGKFGLNSEDKLFKNYFNFINIIYKSCYAILIFFYTEFELFELFSGFSSNFTVVGRGLPKLRSLKEKDKTLLAEFLCEKTSLL